MKKRIERVAVVGAGVMGAAIAAHLVNARFSVCLLDIPPSNSTPEKESTEGSASDAQSRQRLVLQGLRRAERSKPPAFFLPEYSRRIQVGNLQDHRSWLGEADWIIEAVSEDFDVKARLLNDLDRIRRPGSIISSNTSGISVNRLAEGLSDDFRQHWLGTHFFNPPRYLKLLELIPIPQTLESVVETVSHLGHYRLGKGIVVAKDTPNFVANRVGAFALQQLLRMVLEAGYGIDEVDLLTGNLIGRPKSATFRTLDVVGLDTFARVTSNLFENAPGDEHHQLFRIPDVIQRLIEQGRLGAKSGQGFYRKSPDGEILVLDPQSLEYRSLRKVECPSLAVAKSVPDTAKRLRALIESDDRAGQLVWKTLSGEMVYAANRIPEISDDIVTIDHAMKWGFNWELGPFETWDALGVEAVAARLESEGRGVPELVRMVLETPGKRFYRRRAIVSYFDRPSRDYIPLGVPEGMVLLSSLREQKGRVVRKSPRTSLIDLGDGVLCLEFHAKMNTIGDDTLQMIREALQVVRSDFAGMVIGNQGANFSAGADLVEILRKARERKWKEIDSMIRLFQTANMEIKYSPCPVVVAPFGLTLGGGCEIALHASAVQASAETYMGLVELGVGLIPAAGGTKEMVLRSLERSAAGQELFPCLRTSFETIAKARVSGSGPEARSLGFLRPGDGITMNPDRLIADAKRRVRTLVRQGFRKPDPPLEVPALGRPALSTLKIGMHQLLRGAYISPYDFHLGSKLAHIFCGGDCGSPRNVNEQHFLDLEREAFLSVCGEPKSQDRIQHMLQRGKPLRN
ncbi:MAG: 3-hydroxyacyl-CoA dehydrogenase NAD-binding domain-containing protein [Acidobacteriota bacterium]|nr:3-hydroxyacyl-CoA dehydrogenase NAD-binding domain-containing protein [Acidobacteriota bacterium]